ncbi:hypothetical protein ACLOJK_021943, partial [Asimina triloba]
GVPVTRESALGFGLLSSSMSCYCSPGRSSAGPNIGLSEDLILSLGNVESVLCMLNGLDRRDMRQIDLVEINENWLLIHTGENGRVAIGKLVAVNQKMKKWTGGTLIVALAIILLLRYSLMDIHTQKQPTVTFFADPSDNASRIEKDVKKMPAAPPETPEHVKKHFIQIEGADDLFSLSNISIDESRAKLVWAQMHSLVSRSDSLPETAQGVKEASIAWKDLVVTIEKEQTFRADSLNENGAKEKNCPFSLSLINPVSHTNGSLLAIPCGLVIGSSISVVGIIAENHSSFNIEFVSSQLKGEPNASIILHYSVNLQGDNWTHDPIIIQNSRIADIGWGAEERCPSHRASGNLKVDGLVLCNEQLEGTVRDENVNGSQISSKKLLNVTKGSGHISYNFPFVEGHPFTATLWAGVEGFHMNVNGRHETSFAYRERLEPWVVSGVKAAGGLDVLSLMANGLPVFEDPDLVIDVKHLRAPPVPKKRLIMLVGVFSTGNNFERRMAIRRSWMQYETVRSGDVAVRFFIGLTKVLPAKYIMKTDDDAFVRIDRVLSILKEKRVSDGLLYGLISFDSEPHRDKDSKWYISPKEWPHARYPPWAHGPGYVISRDIAKFVVQGHQERSLKLFKLEDVAMGIWIEEYKKRGRKVNYINDDRFHNAGCEDDYILAHYQGPRLMLCLWQTLQKEQKPICCE